jgi:uncharacterized protein
MELPAEILLIALVAAFAQMVNGSMGMGYGTITSTLLLGLGMPPAIMSATVHLAQIGTTGASSLSHWRLGNLDWRLTLALGIPGAAGGFAGAFLITSIPTAVARPAVAVFLLLLGLVILLRFARQRIGVVPVGVRPRFLPGIGGIAGFFDASGGGGWGPISMGTLMARPPTEPRVVIGSVNASEFTVTLAATIGFLIALGWSGFPLLEVFALMAGGVLAAPLAAWLARHMPAHHLGVSVAVLLLVLNTRTLAATIGLEVVTIVALMAAVGAAAIALVVALRGHRRPRPALARIEHRVPARGAHGGAAPAPVRFHDEG